MVKSDRDILSIKTPPIGDLGSVFATIRYTLGKRTTYGYRSSSLIAMPSTTFSDRRTGLAAALLSYIFWGFMTLYWSLLEKADSWEVIAHRVLWTFVFLVLLLFVTKRLGAVRQTIHILRRDIKRSVLLLAAALFASLNWWINVIGVVTEQVVQLGIGTFLTPLISVLLGVFFFSEQLSRTKWIAILLAAIGVGIMIASFGNFPAIALGVSLSWGLYGALKKRLMLDARIGILLEVTLMLPFALFYLGYLESTDLSHFLTGDTKLSLALVGTGIVTSIPLVLFTAAAMKLPMNVLGFCQYLAPILTLLLGIFWFQEPFGREELLPLAFIWTGILLFTVAEIRTVRVMNESNGSSVEKTNVR